MKTFFEKINIKPCDIHFLIKYKLTIDYGKFHHLRINENILKFIDENKMMELLNNLIYIHIKGEYLHYLPNNIENEKLNFNIWNYNSEYNLPQNWLIKKIMFVSSNKQPKIPKTFKYDEIKYSPKIPKTFKKSC